MNVEFGMKVRTRDGHDAGTIRSLVLDPHTGDVKTVVVESGFVIHHDVEAPVEAFSGTSADVAEVRYSLDEMHHLPRFDEARYTEAAGTPLTPGLAFPVGGFLWPAGSPAFPSTPTFSPAGLPVAMENALPGPTDERSEIARDIERENAVIRPGSDVISSDGTKIGEVHNLVFDPETGHPIRITVREGYFFQTETEVPVSAIASVDDYVVYLNVEANETRRWVQRMKQTLI